MTISFYLLLCAGAAMGGFINGLAGFGTALFALGFWLQIMPPAQAVAITLILSVISGLQGAWIVRGAIKDNPKRLAQFLIPGIVGIPIGITALSFLDQNILKLVIASLMIVYGGFFTLRKNLPQFDHPTPFLDSVVGFLGGILGGAASLSGALPTMWCAMRDWTKSETRAVLQPFNIIILALSAAIFAFKGLYNWDVIKLILIALPITMIFSQLGITLFKRLGDSQFRRLIIAMMIVSGSLLMFKELI